MMRTCFALLTLAFMGTAPAAAQPAPATGQQARVPNLAPGSVWTLKDSAACETRAIVRTRNVRDKQERDRTDVRLGIVTTELERQVTVTAANNGLEGVVEYTKAVLRSQAEPAAAAPQVLAVQGRKYPFVKSDAPVNASVKAEGSGPEAAIASRDRLAPLLLVSNMALVRTSEGGISIDPLGWAAISGGYIRDLPSPQQCRSKSSSSAGLTLECTPEPAPDGVRDFIVVHLELDASGLITTTDIIHRRTDEVVTAAATPDESVVRTEVRECKVRTSQSPVGTVAPR